MKRTAIFVSLLLICALVCVGCFERKQAPNTLVTVDYTLVSFEMVSRTETKSFSQSSGFLFLVFGSYSSSAETITGINDYYRFRVRDKSGAISDVMVPVCNHPCFTITYSDDVVDGLPRATLTYDTKFSHYHSNTSSGQCSAKFELPYHEYEQFWELHIPKGSVPQTIDMRVTQEVQK